MRRWGRLRPNMLPSLQETTHATRRRLQRPPRERGVLSSPFLWTGQFLGAFIPDQRRHKSAVWVHRARSTWRRTRITEQPM